MFSTSYLGTVDSELEKNMAICSASPERKDFESADEYGSAAEGIRVTVSPYRPSLWDEVYEFLHRRIGLGRSISKDYVLDLEINAEGREPTTLTYKFEEDDYESVIDCLENRF